MERDLTKVFALLGEKWSLPVLTAVLAGPKRFLAVKASVPGVSQRMLSQALRRLEAQNLITRFDGPPAGAHYYAITRYGTGLFLLTTSFQSWVDSGDHEDAQQPAATDPQAATGT